MAETGCPEASLPTVRGILKVLLTEAGCPEASFIDGIVFLKRVVARSQVGWVSIGQFDRLYEGFLKFS